MKTGNEAVQSLSGPEPRALSPSPDGMWEGEVVDDLAFVVAGILRRLLGAPVPGDDQEMELGTDT